MSRSPQQSRKTLELSHVSSQSAAAAEAETIRRLRREVLGLTLTVDALKKGSKEWVLLSSKLDVAREELEAVLEDQHLFRSISSAWDSEKISPTVSQDELIDKVKALTPPLVASDIVQQLENKLSRAKKYSLEWFEIKKQIDVETKKNRNLNASINPNKNFGRSKSCPKTMGSLPTKHIDAKETRNKSNGLIKFPSTGRTVSQIQTPTIMTIKDGRRNIQSLKDQLLQSPKYSLEWFELKRRISRRSSNNSSSSSRSSSSSKGEWMKENSSPENMTAQHVVNDVPCENCQLSSSDDVDVTVISTTATRSESSLDPDLCLKMDSQELALTTTAVEQTSETRNDLNTDLTESSKDDTDEDDKAAQHKQKLNELLHRVPKYSTEYYQTKKIIKLMQTNNNSR